MEALTVDQFKLALPDKVKKSVNQELIDQVNATLSEPEMFEAYRDNLLSYTKVMADGRFKVQEYVNAGYLCMPQLNPAHLYQHKILFAFQLPVLCFLFSQ